MTVHIMDLNVIEQVVSVEGQGWFEDEKRLVEKGNLDYTLENARRNYLKFQRLPKEERPSHYVGAVVYGSGGLHRYHVDLSSGLLWFSEWHSSVAGIAKAKKAGFLVR